MCKTWQIEEINYKTHVHIREKRESLWSAGDKGNRPRAGDHSVGESGKSTLQCCITQDVLLMEWASVQGQHQQVTEIMKDTNP